ncbi:hypothetical protein LJ756_01015 [Arthrobacter sp. zg-Y411]|uniref:hypothetical protein n=1 Tax=Arthrobacter zhangbolii TaxID=2886936 RepID=UPI001D156A2F|nr:hypothetical protein [Arthrobacter zhangbolii]MCC3293195.1 hypothetical protein [Arthrobacter zhangbolii]
MERAAGSEGELSGYLHPPPGFFLLAAAGIGFGASALVYVLTRKGRKPVRALLWALILAGMACILLAGVLFLR